MRAPGDGQGGAAVEGLEEICMVGAVQGEATVPGIGQLMLYLMVFMAVSWSLMYFIPTTLLFTVMLPASFYVLFSLVVFSPLISGGWPFAPPWGVGNPARVSGDLELGLRFCSSPSPSRDRYSQPTSIQSFLFSLWGSGGASFFSP